MEDEAASVVRVPPDLEVVVDTDLQVDKHTERRRHTREKGNSQPEAAAGGPKVLNEYSHTRLRKFRQHKV